MFTNYIKQVRSYLKHALGMYRLKSLTREILQDFILEMYDKGFSFNSLITIKQKLWQSEGGTLSINCIMCS